MRGTATFLKSIMIHRSLFRRAALVMASASVIAALASPAHADALQEANRLLRQGQYAQALEQVEKHLGAQPRDAQGRFLKGILLTETNRPGEAITVFQKLTEDYPELPEPYNNLAVIYAQQKQYDKAKTALEMAIRTHPAYATAHENLGDIYARLASQAYDKALQLDSSNASAQNKLAMIRELMTGGRGGKGSAKAPTETKPAVVAAAQTKPEPPKQEPPKSEPPKPVTVAAPTPAETPKPASESPRPAAKPAVEAPKAVAKSTGSEAKDPAQAATDWAAAWARKDVQAYLAHYARDFKTPASMSRAQWEEERRGRIQKPAPIEVALEDVRVSIQGDTATVRFRQRYKSGSFKATTGKTLDMVLRDGHWRIQQERVGG